MLKKRWLVDADELILHLNDYKLQQSPIDVQDIESINVRAVIQDCIKAVEEQPTAYDVDKVVEQLEDRSTLSRPVGWSKSYEIVTLEDAIEIVKGGEVNE